MWKMTRKELLDNINSDVNKHTTYKTDYAQYMLSEWWTVANGAGDCEDYALAKYRKCIAAEIPTSELRLATCWTENDGYHAVLLADDAETNTTWVLDNRFPNLKSHWDAISDGYKFDKIQVAGTKDWEDYTVEVKPISAFK